MNTETRLLRKEISDIVDDLDSNLKIMVEIMLQNEYSDDWIPMMDSYFELVELLRVFNFRKFDLYADRLHSIGDAWINHENISRLLVTML